MVLVFAYGSNLCIERLHARTPSARVVSVATLAGHTLRWHKRSRDGSGKCDAFETGCEDDRIWGVVYELTPEDKIVLDAFEGLGEDYFEKTVTVRSPDGESFEATAYVANPELLDENVRPYRWYKGFVTTGAVQHEFPKEYLDVLEAVEEHDDVDRERHEREWTVLEAALRRLRR
ncbi:MAG TPA: gamma-glutamylcyclotransferase family protein [Candidatus Limnocylindrales bacterium]|nr:gamma-glutamylcyclotransferase family protein [Candidatus Limnocylindrales bacterium]